MSRVPIALFYVATFVSGMVVSANLSALIETNPDYAASWWKVIGFSLFAALMILFGISEQDKRASRGRGG